MQPVSDQFLAALQVQHAMSVTARYTVPGGQPVALKVKDGSVTVTSDQNIRRRCSLDVYASSSQFDDMTRDGTLFEVSNGIDFGGGVEELVPVFAGEVGRALQDIGAGGEISLPLQDLGVWIARTDFIRPWVIAPGTTRAAAIAAIVTDSRPGTLVQTTTVGGGTIATAQTFTGSRWSAINALSRDGGLEAFFKPDGGFLIRDTPTTATLPAWTMRKIFTGVQRQRPNDRMYNTVVVRPSATDGSQTWAEQVVQVTDTGNQRHPSRIGVVPRFLASPTAESALAASRAGAILLERVLGRTETLRLGAISNPALEGGDLLVMGTPTLNEEPAQTYRHFVDSFTIGLRTGGISMDTRNQTETE